MTPPTTGRDEADWVLTESTVNVAVGAEIRIAREEAGFSRPELVKVLPFPATVQTLMNWELGKRAVAYAKLVEIGRVVRRSAPELLRRAIDRIEVIDSLMVEIDLNRLRERVDSQYWLLHSWAKNKIGMDRGGSAVVRVHHSVVREWAVALDVPLVQLVGHLKDRAALTLVRKRETGTEA